MATLQDDLRQYDGHVATGPSGWWDRHLPARVALPVLAVWSAAAYFLVQVAVGVLS